MSITRSGITHFASGSNAIVEVAISLFFRSSLCNVAGTHQASIRMNVNINESGMWLMLALLAIALPVIVLASIVRLLNAFLSGSRGWTDVVAKEVWIFLRRAFVSAAVAAVLGFGWGYWKDVQLRAICDSRTQKSSVPRTEAIGHDTAILEIRLFSGFTTGRASASSPSERIGTDLAYPLSFIGPRRH